MGKPKSKVSTQSFSTFNQNQTFHLLVFHSFSKSAIVIV